MFDTGTENSVGLAGRNGVAAVAAAGAAADARMVARIEQIERKGIARLRARARKTIATNDKAYDDSEVCGHSRRLVFSLPVP